MGIAQPRKISDIKPIFGNLALNSQYEVVFGGLSLQLQSYLALRGVDPRFIGEQAGLLCKSASLPGSSVSTFNVMGNYTGVSETFAHGRVFTDIQLEFYVDKEYRTLKFLEHWIEFISSASGQDPSNPGYFYRVKYPIIYKSNSTKILKFNRDYTTELQYNFIGLFPKDLLSLQVSYDDSQVLTASATFSYERYVCGSITSLDQSQNINNNKQPANNSAQPSAPQPVGVSPTLQETQSILSQTSAPLTNVPLVTGTPTTYTTTNQGTQQGIQNQSVNVDNTYTSGTNSTGTVSEFRIV